MLASPAKAENGHYVPVYHIFLILSNSERVIMVMLVIDPAKLAENVFICKTKEDWDATMYSRASYEKELIQATYKGPIERAYSEPHKFPCIAIEGPLIRNSNGPDEYAYLYIYDFEILDE